MAVVVSPGTRDDTHHAHFDGPLVDGCFVCKTGHNLKTCARCRLVSYCGIQHQKQDWNAHKASCNRVRKAQQKCDSEETKLRAIPADIFFPANIFEDHAGYFWGMVETREYMRSLINLAEAEFNMKTTKAVQAGLTTCMEMHRLCRSDNLGIRQVTPIQMMRMGKDQEAYDFMKWWYTNSKDSHYDSGDLSLPYLDLKDESIFEPISQSTDVERPSLSRVAPMTLLKLRLLLDLKAMDDFNNIMEEKNTPLPQEIRDEIRAYLVGSAISKDKGLMEKPNNIHVTFSKLEEELEIYLSLVHKANRHFWPALLNPNQKLEEYPEYTRAGTESVMQVILRHIYPAFVETQGAMRFVREWWETSRAKASDRS